MRELNVMLADDDTSDCYFFKVALEEIPIRTRLEIVNDGEQLMNYLSKNSQDLPNVIFLDLNMPRKNGAECLLEIKKSQQLKDIPVIIYSTSVHENTADELYKNGAHYYLQKMVLSKLPKAIMTVLTSLKENPRQPSRDKFILTSFVEI